MAQGQYYCKLFLSAEDNYLVCLDYGCSQLTLAQPPVVGMRIDVHVQGIPLEPATFEITEVSIVPIAASGWATGLTRGDWDDPVTAIEYWCECELRDPKLGASVHMVQIGNDSPKREVHVAFATEDGHWAEAVVPWDEIVRRAKTTPIDDDD